MSMHKEICLIGWNIPIELMAKLIYGKLTIYEMELILCYIVGYRAND